MLAGRETLGYSRRAFRQNIIVGMLIHTLFAGLDYLMHPDLYAQLWEIRFLLPLPIVAAAFILSQYCDYFSERQSILVAAIVLAVTASVIDMMALLAEQKQYYGYYVGLMLCLIFNYTIKGYHFITASITGGLVLLAYLLSVTLLFPIPYSELVISTFMLVAANIMGMSGMYLFSRFEKQVVHDSYIDPLTGIANRRAYDDYLAEVSHRVGLKHYSKPFTLMLIDIDFFKGINDTHGHPAGDSCLIQISDCLRNIFSRRGDMVARIGGDEFAVILPGTDEASARGMGERLLRNVRELDIRCLRDGVTLSIGLCSITPGDRASVEKIYQRADAALMQAKSRGRDRLVSTGIGAAEATG